MEDRPAIGGSFCLECPYTCTAVYIRYLKTYNPQYGKGLQYIDHIKQTNRMVTEKDKVRACISLPLHITNISNLLKSKVGLMQYEFDISKDHESQPRTGKIRKAKNRVRTQQIIQVDVKDQYKVDLTLSQHCLFC